MVIPMEMIFERSGEASAVLPTWLFVVEFISSTMLLTSELI